jgi:ABC-type uncharacterized transport system permease subunit
VWEALLAQLCWALSLLVLGRVVLRVVLARFELQGG